MLVEVSQKNGKIQAYLRSCGGIIDERYVDSSVIIRMRLGRNQVAELKRLKPERVDMII